MKRVPRQATPQFRRMRIFVLLCLLGYFLHPLPAFPQAAPAASGTDASDEAAARETSPPSVSRQSLDDAWWTGPMLANSAGTLPPGHFLLEPYLYDVSAAHSNSFGSHTYLVYGLADRLSIGMIPVAGYNTVSGGPNSSGVGLGDVTLLAQYQLTQFHEGSLIPTTSFEVQETFPTGKYDQLGDRPSDGLGSGTRTTTLQLNSQTYFWLPDGRILRMRLDISQAFSSNAGVDGVSVYGTGPGFHGNARPGSASYADVAWEYSLTQRWVLALDITYSYERNTRVTGYNISDPDGLPYPAGIRLNSGSSESFGFAPAIEYNWTSNLGMLLGIRVIAGGHNTPGTITPALAINYVH